MVKTTVQIFEIRNFQGFNWIPRDRMNLLTRRMVELRMERNEVIYRPGDHAKDLYCVMEGAIGLSLAGSPGRWLRLALLAPGEFFGVSAIVPGWRRVTRAMALRNSRIGMIDAKVFVSEVCGFRWEIFTAFTDAVIKPLLTVSLRRALLLVEDLTDRVALALWEYANHPDAIKSKGLLPSVLTHEEMAAVVGASRPRVSLALKRLESRGFCVRAGNQIRVQMKPLHDYLERKYDFLI